MDMFKPFQSHPRLTQAVIATFVAGLGVLGVVAFTGILPGPAVHEDVYDVAASGVMPAVFEITQCGDCGTVQQIRAYHLPRAASHRDIIAAIAWANGGEAEGLPEPSRSGKLKYLVTVRMQDGGEMIVTQPAPLSVMVGDQVKMGRFGRLVSDHSSEG
jgi:hypothetical protein